MTRTRRRRTLIASFVAAGLLAPPLLEHGADVALDAKLSRCSSGQGRCGGVDGVDVDLRGLRLGGLWLEREGLRLRARDVAIGPGPRGITATVEGLQATAVLEKPAAHGKERAGAAGSTTAGSADPARGLPASLQGIPLVVEARGEIAIEVGNEIVLGVRDIQIRVGKSRGVDADFVATASHPRLRIESRGRLRAHTANMATGAWRVEGTIALENGAPAKLRATMNRRGTRLRILPSRGGSADLAVPRDWNGQAAITVTARALALDALQPLDGQLPFHADLQHALLDGHLRLTRQDSALSAQLDGVRLRGIAIESPYIARHEVRLGDLGLDGEASLEAGRLRGDLDVSHGKANVHVDGLLGRDRVDLRVRLTPVACQDLLESIPDGFTDAIEGMTLAGDIEGSLRLRVAMADAREARALEQQTGQEQPAPGQLDVDFPFVERCRVTRDAPSVDLLALRGPYRYRFVTDSGTQRQRLLERGAPGFVPLAAIPNLGRAFVTLEDSRFWRHDGFDTEQIERAVWHNLASGRVERGASTITQQAARNLWLGLDRSISRKLQEALLAARLEQGLSKQRILELYVNVIELGPDIHGVANAARFHFGKAAHELNLLEAVHLAALAPGPRLFSRRFASGQVDEKWMGQLHRQIRRMYLHRRISRDAMRAALRGRLVLVDHTVEESA